MDARDVLPHAHRAVDRRGRQCNKLSSTVANIVSLIDSDGPVYQAER